MAMVKRKRRSEATLPYGRRRRNGKDRKDRNTPKSKRHAPNGQPRLRTATRDVPTDVAVWSDEWPPKDENRRDESAECVEAKSSRECAERLAVPRRLAYRRVPLHSEVSCRCELTGSLCCSWSLLAEPLAAARTGNNASSCCH